MRKSMFHLCFLTVSIAATVTIAVLTEIPYANAFLVRMEPLVITFCVFMGMDVLRWLIRMTLEDARLQSKGSEISWTIGVIICMVYFLWRNWYYYSLWQVAVTAVVCSVMVLGLLVRLLGHWDADCVRWDTWAVCCLVVGLAIAGSLLLLKPMRVTEAEQLTIISEEDDQITFSHIDSSKFAETPLGYYMFYQKQADGSLPRPCSGRAVIYLGEGQEEWRKPYLKE